MGFSMGSPATPLKISALPAPAHICFLGLENEHFLGNFRLKCQNGAETSEFQGFLTFGDLYEVPRTTPRSISSPSPRPHMFFENGLCILLLEGPLCARACQRAWNEAREAFRQAAAAAAAATRVGIGNGRTDLSKGPRRRPAARSFLCGAVAVLAPFPFVGKLSADALLPRSVPPYLCMLPGFPRHARPCPYP